ncbi:MAG TPA: hypothetical protein VGP85_17215 [Pyrinomonadaceae bacterium]|nr:hypothetical protein [Pyrinomonadaceae bacterium]
MLQKNVAVSVTNVTTRQTHIGHAAFEDNPKTVTSVSVDFLLLIQTAGMRKPTIIASAFLICILAATAKSQTQTKELESEAINGKSVSAVISKPSSPMSPAESLKNAKTIYVKSSSLLVGTSVIEDKLKKRKEFDTLGLSITRDAANADLVLHVEHDLFTMYTYTVLDPHSQILVATGKLSSLGGTVAGKVAKRFMKQMVEARVR